MVEKEEIKGLKMDRRASRFKRICVFCGSSSGKKTLYRNVALDLGKEMVKRKIDLVYGGGSVGLMGQIAQTVHDGGGHVIGVIPKALMPQEISGQTVGELRAVSDMHERKAEMARQADAFIALPVTHQRKNTLAVVRALSNGKFFAPQSDGYFALSGGYGTLEELLEMITWVQLGIHDKPVGLLNVDGYYNSLLALFDKAVEEGFLKPSARNILLSAPTARELLEKFEEYEPTHERIVARGSWEVDMRGDMRGLENMGYNAAVNC